MHELAEPPQDAAQPSLRRTPGDAGRVGIDAELAQTLIENLGLQLQPVGRLEQCGAHPCLSFGCGDPPEKVGRRDGIDLLEDAHHQHDLIERIQLLVGGKGGDGRLGCGFAGEAVGRDTQRREPHGIRVQGARRHDLLVQGIIVHGQRGDVADGVPRNDVIARRVRKAGDAELDVAARALAYPGVGEKGGRERHRGAPLLERRRQKLLGKTWSAGRYHGPIQPPDADAGLSGRAPLGRSDGGSLSRGDDAFAGIVSADLRDHP